MKEEQLLKIINERVEQLKQQLLNELKTDFKVGDWVKVLHGGTGSLIANNKVGKIVENIQDSDFYQGQIIKEAEIIIQCGIKYYGVKDHKIRLATEEEIIKAKKEAVDFTKLKVGSTVKLQFTNYLVVSRSDNTFNFNEPCKVLILESNHYLSNDIKLDNRPTGEFNTFIQDSRIISFSNENINYITEVIEY